MKITRKTNISFITERKTTALSPSVASEVIYCRECAAEMFPAQNSADFFGFSSRVIYRLIEAGRIHFLETESNEVYICSVSATKVLQNIF